MERQEGFFKQWVIGKFLTLPKYEDFTKLHDPNKRKMKLPLLSTANFLIVWRCHGVLCFHFYFFVLNQSLQRRLGWEQLPSLLWWFFGRCHSESYLVTYKFKVLSQQLRCKLTMVFERYFTVEDFTEIDQRTCKSIINQHTSKAYLEQNSFVIKHNETKIDKGAWKIISCTKIEALTSKNITPK